jgi:hypothetical protein
VREAAASGPRERALWLGLAGLGLALFGAPLGACLWLGGDFTDLANESMAYRYFFCERVLHGETIVVGVGYLVSLVHHLAYALVDHVLRVPPLDLRARINAFALLTNAIIVALMGAIFLTAALSRRLNRAQRLLVLMAGLVPLYGNGFMGFDYALMADYHHLDMVLMAGCVLMFARNWMAHDEEVTGWSVARNALLLGVFAANKVTVLPMAGIVLMPFFVGRKRRFGQLLGRGVLAGLALVLGFFLVHLAAYLGRFSALRTMLPIWFSFVANPGGELEFWTSTFLKHFWRYNTGLFCLLFLLVLAASIGVFTAKRAWTFRRSACVAAIVVAGALYGYAVIKRPAGSTLFESGNWLLVLALIQLGMLSTLKVGRQLAAWVAAGLAVVMVVSFPLGESVSLVRLSKPNADAKFAFYQRVLELAHGRPITVILIDNSFHHEGFHELLLKGASTFPSWHISATGQEMIARYGPGITFRSHDEPVPPLGAPIPDDSVLVLFSTQGADPLTGSLRVVHDFSALPTSRHEEWRLPRKADGFVVGTIVYTVQP